MGLTARLLLLGFLALVPAFVIQAYDEYTLRRDREAEVHRLALEQATLASFDLERIFTGVQNLLVAVSQAPGVRTFEAGRCVPYLASLHRDVPHLLSIAVSDTTGNVRCRDDLVAHPGLDLANQSYFGEAVKGTSFVVGEYTISQMGQRPVLPLAVPMREESGAVSGVVVAALSLDWLTAQLRERGYPKGGSVTVADRNGVVLAREPDPERFIGTRIPERLMNLVDAPRPGTIEITSQDGTRRVLGYIPLSAPPQNIYLSSGIPSKQAFASVNAATQRGAVLLGVGLLLAMGTSLFVGRMFIKQPVDRLLQAAEAWRNGDFSARTGLSRNGGELSRIGAVFDGVAAEVQQRSNALRESEARLRSLADNLPNGMVYQLIATGGGERRFLYVSEGVERLMGVKATDALADPANLYGRIIPEDHPIMVEAEAEALAAMSLFNAELRIRAPDDSIRWLRLTSAPRPTPDGGTVWDGVGLDITARKEAEQELRAINDTLELRVAERTTELAAANEELIEQIAEREAVEATLRQMQRLEAVGQLTSGVAHDFNNLLTVIVGNAEFLEGADLEERNRRRVAMIRTAAERGAKLTGQLLAFSRRQRLAPRRLHLNETVAGMTELLQSTMGGRVQVETRLEPELWEAFVDPTQIELVILNLAINARDAMPGGGALTVETANVHVEHAPTRPEGPGPGDYAMIAVRDTGTGMTDEVRAKAFEPFFTTKDVGKGSGLGLAQVYGFAKQSGGGVRIETGVGRGTAIQVFLPRADPAQEAEPPAAIIEPLAPIADGRLLLVDDDADVREVTASILEDLGYGVTEAGSGAAALEALADGAEYNLLVVDFAMPGMNGSDVAREARSRRPGLPVLFVTGYADLTLLKGVAGEHVLQKPYRADELARKIASILGGGPESRPS